MRRLWPAPAIVLALAACTDSNIVGSGSLVDPPTNLQYVVEPSGDPASPSGILLRWDFDNNPDLEVWHVYSRGSTSDSYQLRGSTTSNSFHDDGIPHLQYYVTAEDIEGGESEASNVITVDERLALERPATLTSTSLDGAIGLVWSDNPFTTDPQGFSSYRVYSTSYDLDAQVCGVTWSLEGTTVAPEFIAASLANGVPRCFGVSAVSVEGFESLWSPVRSDTPRPDVRNVVLYARQQQDAQSGFRFWRDIDGDGQADLTELGQIGSGSAADIDFSVERDISGALFLAPVRLGTGVELYAAAPVEDLTSIDYAIVQTYRTTPIQASPGFGYVFEMNGGDGFARYGAIRVTHVGQNFLILDWAFQTDPGNPELVVVKR